MDVASMSDADIQREAAVFSFDLEGCGKRLKRGDNWQRIIQTHLFFDHALSRMIAEALAKPNEVHLDRTSFAAKIELGASLDLFASDFKPFLRNINRLRNLISHDLGFVITAKHVRGLYQVSDPLTRTAIDDESAQAKKLPFLYHCCIVNLLLFDMLRQRHVARRLHEQRGRIKLRAALRNADGALRKARGEPISS